MFIFLKSRFCIFDYSFLLVSRLLDNLTQLQTTPRPVTTAAATKTPVTPTEPTTLATTTTTTEETTTPTTTTTTTTTPTTDEKPPVSYNCITTKIL